MFPLSLNAKKSWCHTGFDFFPWNKKKLTYIYFFISDIFFSNNLCKRKVIFCTIQDFHFDFTSVAKDKAPKLCMMPGIYLMLHFIGKFRGGGGEEGGSTQAVSDLSSKLNTIKSLRVLRVLRPLKTIKVKGTEWSLPRFTMINHVLILEFCCSVFQSSRLCSTALLIRSRMCLTFLSCIYSFM